jgi:hypothetical protein
VDSRPSSVEQNSKRGSNVPAIVGHRLRRHRDRQQIGAAVLVYANGSAHCGPLFRTLLTNVLIGYASIDFGE